MYTLGRARNSLGNQGKPLPTVFPVLEKFWKMKHRRGEVGMVAAAPGVGKSVYALNYAIRSGVTTLYISPDTSAADTLYRAAAIITGDTIDEVENAYENGRGAYYDNEVNKQKNLRFAFEGPVTLDDLDLELMAYAEVYGDYPELVVIDNLRDIETEAAGETWEKYDVALDCLKFVARDTGAHIMVLHHLTGPFNDGTKTAGQGGIQGQATKILALCLTLAIGGDDFSGKTMMLCAAKNRGGKADPSGQTYVEIAYEPARAWLG